jgi:hypothetical protein
MSKPSPPSYLESVVDVAERDLSLAMLLRRLGDASQSDEVWGALLRKRYDSQAVRRIYVRLFISFVESVVASIKADMLADPPRPLSLSEQALLTESAVDVSDTGDIRDRPLLLQIGKNVRFAFKFYAANHNLAFTVDFGGEGWRAFVETVRVRNRITHPKRLEEMSISDDELAVIDRAHDWFVISYTGLLAAHINVLKAENARFAAQQAVEGAD